MTPTRRRPIAYAALALIAAGVLALPEPEAPPVPEVVAPALRPKPVPAAAAPTLLALEPRVFEPSAALFRVPPPPGPRPEVLAAERRERAEQRPPAPPPVPYRYLGVVVREGRATALLRMHERDYVVEAGEVIDGNYRIEAIAPARVELTYLPLAAAQSLPLYEPRPLAVSEAQ